MDYLESTGSVSLGGMVVDADGLPQLNLVSAKCVDGEGMGLSDPSISSMVAVTSEFIGTQSTSVATKKVESIGKSIVVQYEDYFEGERVGESWWHLLIHSCDYLLGHPYFSFLCYVHIFQFGLEFET